LHSVELWRHGRNDLVVTRQSDEAIVGREQERDAVIAKQGAGVAFPSAAGSERAEVLAEPPTHVVLIHDPDPIVEALAECAAALARSEVAERTKELAGG
jgi:hypothetical protein